MNRSPMPGKNRKVRRTFWAAAVFYILIAFEFFYMATPFAFYFYSAYRPGLNLIAEYPGLSWLTGFFLPHVVAETSSTLINLHNPVGAILFIAGLIAFLIGAGQVYYNKLFRKGAVTGGIYKYIRHPQYSALSISGLGLLLLWPRFLVLLIYVTMLFAYYSLARLEERECEEKFGQSYLDYKKRTGMFLPFRLPIPQRVPAAFSARWQKVAFGTIIYLMTVAVSLVAARGIQRWTIGSLYTLNTDKAIYISVTSLGAPILQSLRYAVEADPEINNLLDTVIMSSNERFLNYIVPADWYISEIPMRDSPELTSRHLQLANNTSGYKVIFTLARFLTNDLGTGNGILTQILSRKPLVEVWLDSAGTHVMESYDLGDNTRYKNTPVPVF